MQSDFVAFFLDVSKWMGKPVLFISKDTQLKGVLEHLRVHSRITTHQGKPIEARIAVLDVRVPGEKPKPWELDQTLWQLQCDFDRPQSKLERTPLGNIFFRSGTITGLIVLSDNEESLLIDPSAITPDSTTTRE